MLKEITITLVCDDPMVQDRILILVHECIIKKVAFADGDVICLSGDYRRLHSEPTVIYFTILVYSKKSTEVKYLKDDMEKRI